MTATPRSIAAATKLLEQYADLDARIALVESDRSAAIAAANQRADVAAEPMIKARDDIAAVLESWWPYAVGADVPKGKKSMQLGGCMLGTRMSRPKLAHIFESDDKAIAAIPGRIFKHCTKIKYALDRTGIVKLLQLGGKAALDLAGCGFSLEQSDVFFIERVQQGGTIGQ